MKIGNRKVSVTSPARLHFGFLDLNGAMGRRFGSVGMALEGPGVSVTAQQASAIAASGEQSARVREFAEAMRSRFGWPAEFRLTVERAIPEHAGLGSGTQLGIAVGIALARLHRIDLPVRDIAAVVERGRRSGIGIGAFESGGFLVDGGRGASGELPPIVARAEFPPEWRVVLVFDRIAQGLHGAAEIAAFDRLPEFPQRQAAHLCHLMLMQALPALKERDLNAFCAAIGELQRITGDHFAPAQGGRFSSPRIGKMLAWMEGRGLSGIGQSSWGPTGFAIVGSAGDAVALVEAARERPTLADSLEFMICQGRNAGGQVDVVESPYETAQLNS